MKKAKKRLFAGGKKFDPQKHPRAQGGRFANKPGAGDDAPQGGKAHGVTAVDQITVLAPRNPRTGPAAARFGHYKTGMTVRDYITAVEGAGENAQTALKAIAWDHARGWIRIDDPAEFAKLQLGGVAPPASVPGAGAGQRGALGPAGMPDEATRLAWVKQANAAFDANINKSGDVGLAKFQELAGRHGSDVLDEAAFAAYQGELVLRGVASKSVVRSQYDEAENFFGTGVYGNGQYYGGPGAHNVPWSYAKSLNGGWVFASKLSSQAVTITRTQLDIDQRTWLNANSARLDAGQRAFLSDEGRWAAFMGYDAIRVDGYNYVVGLNKRAFVVAKQSLPGEDFETQASVPQPPDPKLVQARVSTEQSYHSVVQQISTQSAGGQVASSSAITQLTTLATRISQLNSQIAASAKQDLEHFMRSIFRTKYGAGT